MDYRTLDDLPQFNFASALADMGDDVDGFRELVDIFREELPGMLAANDAAQDCVERMLPVLHEAANTLGALGAPRDARHLRRLEDGLRRGETLNLVDVATQVRQALLDTAHALEHWLNR